MKKNEMLKEMVTMWTWLYKHPAHDREYYMTHVLKLAQPWKNLCPLCELDPLGQKCAECLMKEGNQAGNFCSDPDSPLNKWKDTNTNNPDNRTFYAGEVIAIAKRIKGKVGAAA
jgi:hypothetical protein